MESQINPHDDISLSEKIYPSGDKSEAQAMCICGAVKINIKTQSPEMSAFCHCWSCRRAHSAPMYHVIYCCTANIDRRTGKKKSGNFEITVFSFFHCYYDFICLHSIIKRKQHIKSSEIH